MSVAAATRFDMLKKAAVEAIAPAIRWTPIVGNSDYLGWLEDPERKMP